MQAFSQFNINDRAWILVKTESSPLKISEVIIEGIAIDFVVNNEGEIVPNISYYVRKKNEKRLDEDFLPENEIFADLNDLKAKMEIMFDHKVINFPKTYSLTQPLIDEAA